LPGQIIVGEVPLAKAEGERRELRGRIGGFHGARGLLRPGRGASAPSR
jgi:hypothetical protein